MARTLGHDGKWTDKGWIISTKSSERSVRVRNLGDRVGLWWEEYRPKKDRYVDSYVEIVDGKKVTGKGPGEPPALDIASWHEKLSSAPGWPVPAGKKGVRIRWDGEKFVISWKKVKRSGTRYRFYRFSATCS